MYGIFYNFIMMQVIRIRVRVVRFFLFAILVLLLCVWYVPEERMPPLRSPARHLPLSYWQHLLDFPHRYSRSGCILPPTLRELQHSVKFWQRVSDSGSALVYAAYWDARGAHPIVRLLVNSHRGLKGLTCLFWYYNKGDPISIPAFVPPQQDGVTVHVVSCPPPLSNGSILAAVSIVPPEFKCGIARNILLIQGPRTKKQKDHTGSVPGSSQKNHNKVAVCLSWWRKGDAAIRLAEWLSLLQLLQVDRVYMYLNDHAHFNVLQVVDYFSFRIAPTLVDIMPYMSPPLEDATNSSDGLDFPQYSDQDNNNVSDTVDQYSPILETDLFPYNECIYRAITDDIVWLAFLDLDEVILPIRDGSIHRLAYKESQNAADLPDVLEFPSYWFPEYLQDLETGVEDEEDISTTLSWEQVYSIEPVKKVWTSPSPILLPPGRMYRYERRALYPRQHVAATGKLVRVASVASISSRHVACISGDCVLRTTENTVARMHLYSSRCGKLSRGLCRALRRTAVKDDTLVRYWRRAQQNAYILTNKVNLWPHRSTSDDDE